MPPVFHHIGPGTVPLTYFQVSLLHIPGRGCEDGGLEYCLLHSHGLLEYLLMPYVMASALAGYQSVIIHEVLSDMLHRNVMDYIVDMCTWVTGGATTI